MISYACLHPQYFQAILEGRKIFEFRLSKYRCAPYQKVQQGDTIYFAETGSSRVIQCTIDDVEFYNNLIPTFIEELITEFAIDKNSSEYLTQKKRSAKYCSIILLGNPQLVNATHPHPQGWLLKSTKI